MRQQIELTNEVARELAGSGDAVLREIERHVDCEVYLRGNVVTLDGDEVAVLRRERKRRLDAAEQFRTAGREDLVAAEEEEADLIGAYLPAELSDEELRTIVEKAVADAGAESPRDMGMVMKLVMPAVDGRADGKRVSAQVKEVLTDA